MREMAPIGADGPSGVAERLYYYLDLAAKCTGSNDIALRWPHGRAIWVWEPTDPAEVQVAFLPNDKGTSAPLWQFTWELLSDHLRTNPRDLTKADRGDDIRLLASRTMVRMVLDGVLEGIDAVVSVDWLREDVEHFTTGVDQQLARARNVGSYTHSGLIVPPDV